MARRIIPVRERCAGALQYGLGKKYVQNLRDEVRVVHETMMDVEDRVGADMTPVGIPAGVAYTI